MTLGARRGELRALRWKPNATSETRQQRAGPVDRLVA
jgi:hypothetical protein